MKSLGQFLEEAKATYCGRCGTTHVPPSKGGTCPALKEEDELEEGMKEKIKGAIRRSKEKEHPLQTRRDVAMTKGGAAYSKGETRKGDQYMAYAERDRKKKSDPSSNPAGTYRTKTTDYNEDVNQIDELSADTLSNYIDKASDAKGHRNLSTKKVDNRYKGVALAQKKGDEQAAKMVPKKLKPVKTDYERQMDAAHGQIYREEKETTMKTLRQFLEQVNTVEDQIDETVENELTEADMQAHVQRVKKKKNQDVSFTHSQSGKKVTGKMMGIKTRGGMPYAHVETGKMAYHVPVHQVD